MLEPTQGTVFAAPNPPSSVWPAAWARVFEIHSSISHRLLRTDIHVIPTPTSYCTVPCFPFPASHLVSSRLILPYFDCSNALDHRTGQVMAMHHIIPSGTRSLSPASHP
ncbi:hypothetical protein H0G86_001875 [Trichoderma simmonsii]|uniref:Uncharacterized protein n=1 Tax=Trichoderma simmonsii TaxID=1491479 RepID=A0A8G0P9M3_9HYPO|nr:hypothetical protein H0G86_001875 [Trichoderma simmonsii]